MAYSNSTCLSKDTAVFKISSIAKLQRGDYLLFGPYSYPQQCCTRQMGCTHPKHAAINWLIRYAARNSYLNSVGFTAHVFFQLNDHCLLIFNDVFHQIANRNQANQVAV